MSGTVVMGPGVNPATAIVQAQEAAGPPGNPHGGYNGPNFGQP